MRGVCAARSTATIEEKPSGCESTPRESAASISTRATNGASRAERPRLARGGYDAHRTCSKRRTASRQLLDPVFERLHDSGPRTAILARAPSLPR